MYRKIDFVEGFLLIMLRNQFSYENGPALNPIQERLMQMWLNQSAENREKFDRYTCKEWLEVQQIAVKENMYTIAIEDLLYNAFKEVFGASIQHHYRYFYLVARYIVVGLSEALLQEVTAWAAQSDRNQRVFDQLTAPRYAKHAIRGMKECMPAELYDWYMAKYHPSSSSPTRFPLN